jgi:hypothetical protein
MTPVPSSSDTNQIIEQDIIGGFGFALGGVIASLILIWIGGARIKKVLRGV